MTSINAIVRTITSARYKLDRRQAFSRIKLSDSMLPHAQAEKLAIAEQLANALTAAGAIVINRGLTPYRREHDRSPHGLPFVQWRGKP